MTRRLLIALPLLLSCAASEEEVKADFDAFISDHNSCQLADECTVIAPGCPLGCLVAVRTDAADEAEKLASELIDDYERGGRGCDYGCVDAAGADCVDGRCADVADD